MWFEAACEPRNLKMHQSSHMCVQGDGMEATTVHITRIASRWAQHEALLFQSTVV